MPSNLILTGDINLMNVTDPTVPLRKVAGEFRAADFVFSNLECCLYQPPQGESVDKELKSEGFFATPGPGGDALKQAGIKAVGIANNVNYGADAILASVARLDQLGILHTGAGADHAAACKPVILENGGLRVGFLQRTAVYWPTNHEAGKSAAGVAAIKCHTAYQLPLHKTRPDIPPCNRPGLPPVILTWVDAKYLQSFKDDIAALRAKADIVVVSCHWGLHQEVLQYMPELAHAAIDAGADVVIGHGPHYSLPVESYKGKPVFYGLGSFSFHTGHGGLKHGNWVGMMARITLDGKAVKRATFQFVRHNEQNETVPCEIGNELETLKLIEKLSAPYNTRLTPSGDQVEIDLSK
jgi:poly-gamma-glutamate capsule biosynthesis protein CapA/YwtB (metallophosphatase superfamily)